MTGADDDPSPRATHERPGAPDVSQPTGADAPDPERGALDQATRRAAVTFRARIEGEYPTVDLLVFGSRARGRHAEDSDADLAVILAGPRGDRYAMAGAMAEIAFDVMLETGVLVDPLPLWQSELDQPELFGNPALIAAIKRDGRRP